MEAFAACPRGVWRHRPSSRAAIQPGLNCVGGVRVFRGNAQDVLQASGSLLDQRFIAAGSHQLRQLQLGAHVLGIQINGLAKSADGGSDVSTRQKRPGPI